MLLEVLRLWSNDIRGGHPTVSYQPCFIEPHEFQALDTFLSDGIAANEAGRPQGPHTDLTTPRKSSSLEGTVPSHIFMPKGSLEGTISFRSLSQGYLDMDPHDDSSCIAVSRFTSPLS